MTILDNVLPEPEKPKEGQVNVNILPGEADIQDLVKQERERKEYVAQLEETKEQLEHRIEIFAAELEEL